MFLKSLSQITTTSVLTEESTQFSLWNEESILLRRIKLYVGLPEALVDFRRGVLTVVSGRILTDDKARKFAVDGGFLTNS